MKVILTPGPTAREFPFLLKVDAEKVTLSCLFWRVINEEIGV